MNQDQKLSLNEIKKALKYTLYFKYHNEDQSIVLFLKKIIEKFIDEYVELDWLNYKQFSYFFYRFNYDELVKIVDNYKNNVKKDL